MALDLKKYKKNLESELSSINEELETVGFKDPDNPNDWVPRQDNLNTLNSDENELADTIEDYEDNSAILKQLEIRYNELKSALERIEKGTYGICSVGGEKIAKERLEANPAAETCLEHAK